MLSKKFDVFCGGVDGITTSRRGRVSCLPISILDELAELVPWASANSGSTFKLSEGIVIRAQNSVSLLPA